MTEDKPEIVQDLTHLWELTNLSKDDYEALSAEVSEAHPTPRIQGLCDLVAQEHQALMLALIRLSTHLRPRVSLVDSEVRDLLTDHMEQITQLPPSRVSDEQLTRAIDRSLGLLNCKSLQFFRKGEGLRTSHEHTFLHGEVVADLRPIVDTDSQTGDSRVVAMLRRHNLIITTIDYKGNRDKHFFVLEDEDLPFFAEMFQKALDSALALEQYTEQNCLLDVST